jgi:DnaK suppressor protein
MTQAPSIDDTAAWDARLRELKASLQQQLEETRDSAKPVDLGESIGRLTRMDALQQQQMALATRDRLRKRLQAVSAAIARLEAGTFGECVDCGESIEPRRLEARPESFFCLPCQRSRG